MQKAQLLEVKEKGGTSMLTKVTCSGRAVCIRMHVPPRRHVRPQINRECPKYIIHTPPAATHAQAQDEAASAAGHAGSGSSIAVRSLFRPTTEHAQLLNVCVLLLLLRRRWCGRLKAHCRCRKIPTWTPRTSSPSFLKSPLPQQQPAAPRSTAAKCA